MGKTELVNTIAKALVEYGYDVYLSKDKRHGFYTDGKRVVSFGGSWEFCVSYSGNYKSKQSGTGWVIAQDIGVISEETAKDFITRPTWVRDDISYTTPEQHLATYGQSSGYTKFEEEVAA
jgi:hypothetical protein